MGSPVLRNEAVDSRVGVAVVDHDPDTEVLVLSDREVLVERNKVLLREGVVEAHAVVAAEKVSFGGHVKGVPDGGDVGVNLHGVSSSARIVVEGPADFPAPEGVGRPGGGQKETIFVRAIIVESVVVVSSDFLGHLVEEVVAVVREASVGEGVFQGGFGARRDNGVVSLGAELSMSVHEGDVPPGAEITVVSAEDLCAGASVSDRETFQIDAGVVLNNAAGHGGDVNSSVALPRKVKLLRLKLGELIVEGLEREEVVLGGEVISPVSAAGAVGRGVVAEAETNRRGRLEDQQVS
mmetsp:Transcript_23359/g.43920  ORF Transcript_23359/g.43920 Transcript_23359/m.43920 type:complete len:294 (+) Transcript_23359:302-1183(+)